jgi:hypothetical protein
MKLSASKTERQSAPEGLPMHKSIRKFGSAVVVAALLLLATGVHAEGQTLTPAEAANHTGEQGTVCGTVASAHFANRTRGQPTFINLDRPYPNQIFTALIWGSDRSKFNHAPETYYPGKTVCVTGTIKSYQGKPEIIVKSPEQIRLQ